MNWWFTIPILFQISTSGIGARLRCDPVKQGAEIIPQFQFLKNTSNWYENVADFKGSQGNAILFYKSMSEKVGSELSDVLFNRFWADRDMSYHSKSSDVLCRNRRFPTLISKIKKIWFDLSLTKTYQSSVGTRNGLLTSSWGLWIFWCPAFYQRQSLFILSEWMIHMPWLILYAS